MRVHCEMCDSLVPAYGVHSCFDAALLKQQQEAKKEAERAVIEAAKAWTTDQRGWLKPLDEALAQAVDTLRELEAET